MFKIPRLRYKPKGRKRPRAWHRTCRKPLWAIAMEVRRRQRSKRTRGIDKQAV